MPYEGPQKQELQDGVLTLVRMRMPAVHCWHAERTLVYDTVTVLMMHAKQTKEWVNSSPFITGELEITGFVVLRLVLFLLIKFLNEVINTLQEVISK